MMLHYIKLFIVCFAGPCYFLSIACAPPPTQFDDERQMTLGTVQKEIKIGMSQAEIIEAMGSPNMVTRDQDGNETWVYDKIATEASVSGSSVSTGLVLTLLVGASSQNARSSTTQRTLTVVFKFDKDGKLKKFSYHATKF